MFVVEVMRSSNENQSLGWVFQGVTKFEEERTPLARTRWPFLETERRARKWRGSDTQSKENLKGRNTA